MRAVNSADNIGKTGKCEEILFDLLYALSVLGKLDVSCHSLDNGWDNFPHGGL